jgi:integrase
MAIELAAQRKASKGVVGVESFQGRLRLRLPRQVYAGKQKYLSLGLDDTTENRVLANGKAKQIEADIAYERFDPTLAKYRPEYLKPVNQVDNQLLNQPDLLELWDKYTEYRKPQLQLTTLKAFYAPFRNHIAKFPTKSLNDAIAIRDYIIANIAADTGKRLLVRLNACCNWAVESGLIAKNPFIGMAKQIKLKSKSDDEDIDPFTLEERDIIIAAFESHPQHKRYAAFIKFLFFTGCRPSEAIALQWKHITPDLSTITFCEAFTKGIRKDTKNHKARRFPVNSKLRELLESIRPDNYCSESLVFPSSTNKPMNWDNFQRIWRGANNKGKKYIGIVTQLVEQGKIERYRNPYQTRHSFATLALQNGLTLPDVARLIGNSPEVCLKHYASSLRNLQVPEF